MDAKVAEQILDELVPTLEALETQSTAITRFLRDKGIATDEELAPYWEQEANASTVRWRTIGLRMKRLFSLAEKTPEKASEEKSTAGAAGEKNSAKPKREKPKGDQSKSSGENQREDAETKLTGSQAASTQTAEGKRKADEGDKQHTSHEGNEEDAA